MSALETTPGGNDGWDDLLTFLKDERANLLATQAAANELERLRALRAHLGNQGIGGANDGAPQPEPEQPPFAKLSTADFWQRVMDSES